MFPFNWGADWTSLAVWAQVEQSLALCKKKLQHECCMQMNSRSKQQTHFYIYIYTVKKGI